MNEQRALGCLIGLALGDALAAPTEFLTVEAILQRFPPYGPQAPPGDPARVTDDTQMALAVGEALHASDVPLRPDQVEARLRAAFVQWANSEDNNRAPGRTCMTACDRLGRGMPWQQATVAYSKGCGANMRVAPVPLFCRAHGLDLEICAALAQFQAALTHGHPTALAAADLTAVAIVWLMEGVEPDQLVARLHDYAVSQRHIYHAEWLGALWERAMTYAPHEFIAQGWDECVHVLERLEQARDNQDRATDPCLQTGDGWIAEEALATGLLCFVLFTDDPVGALRRAAVTRGDSDSIACLTGAFAGAYHGVSAWPREWVARIEYRERLQALGTIWDIG